MRCAPVAAGTLMFAASVNASAAPVGTQIRVTLPAGLLFTDGSRARVVTISQQGLVPVPAFSATGSAGTYTLTATYNGASATQPVEVVPAPGSVVELRRSTGSTATTAAFSTVTVAGVGNAVAGAVQGDQTAASAGANGAVLTAAGTVRLWGANVGATAATPSTLQFNGAALTGVTAIDTWTSTGGGSPALAQATGGVAAGSTGAAVHQWHRTGTDTGTPTVVKVSGISGPVLQVAAEDGASYVLTTAGVHRWTTTTDSASPAVSVIAGTAGATLMSTWSHRAPTSDALRHGGAAVHGATVHLWTGTSVSTTTLPTGVGPVARLIATDSGVMVLGTNGTLWSFGTGFGTGTAATTWTSRASGVADFSMWGFTSYVGGLWISTSGAVTQFFGHQGWVTPVAVRSGHLSSGTALSGITKTYSSDGTYLALKTDGTVYAWGGNLDNSGRGPATTIATGSGTTVDLNVWGHHLQDVYYGGGYVIKAAPGC